MSKKLRVHPHHTDGTVNIFHIPADTDLPMTYRSIHQGLDSFRREIGGGWIEVVSTGLMPELRCGCQMVMVVDEEGLVKRLPANLRAGVYYPWNTICGDVFLIGQGPVKGSDGVDIEFFSLPPEFNNWEGPGSGYPEFIIDSGAQV